MWRLQKTGCGECCHCKDKPKFGGLNHLKQCCVKLRCIQQQQQQPQQVRDTNACVHINYIELWVHSLGWSIINCHDFVSTTSKAKEYYQWWELFIQSPCLFILRKRRFSCSHVTKTGTFCRYKNQQVFKPHTFCQEQLTLTFSIWNITKYGKHKLSFMQ